MPAKDLGPLPVKLTKAGPSHWVSYGMQLPVKGVWTMNISVLVTDVKSVPFTTQLTAR